MVVDRLDLSWYFAAEKMTDCYRSMPVGLSAARINPPASNRRAPARRDIPAPVVLADA
jgi:hypothetical protein